MAPKIASICSVPASALMCICTFTLSGIISTFFDCSFGSISDGALVAAERATFVPPLSPEIRFPGLPLSRCEVRAGASFGIGVPSSK